jgi:acetyl-CoA synthetase
MSWQPIAKSPDSFRAPPNLGDYAAVRAFFSWEKAKSMLDGLPQGSGLNIAHEAVDRHAAGARAQQVAFRAIAKTGTARDLTFERLREETNRFANVLGELGVNQASVSMC